jgi:uncharacterized protein
LGERLVAAGRMAFSNYVGTSLLMALVFQGWAVMLRWSRPWLARFRYGPLEWLWRCLTYGRWFPIRR